MERISLSSILIRSNGVEFDIISANWYVTYKQSSDNMLINI